MIYTHVLSVEAGAVQSPLDALAERLGHRLSRPVADAQFAHADQGEPGSSI
jgi:hypothetical protein